MTRRRWRGARSAVIGRPLRGTQTVPTGVPAGVAGGTSAPGDLGVARGRPCPGTSEDAARGLSWPGALCTARGRSGTGWHGAAHGRSAPGARPQGSGVRPDPAPWGWRADGQAAPRQTTRCGVGPDPAPSARWRCHRWWSA